MNNETWQRISEGSQRHFKWLSKVLPDLTWISKSFFFNSRDITDLYIKGSQKIFGRISKASAKLTLISKEFDLKKAIFYMAVQTNPINKIIRKSYKNIWLTIYIILHVKMSCPSSCKSPTSWHCIVCYRRIV